MNFFGAVVSGALLGAALLPNTFSDWFVFLWAIPFVAVILRWRDGFIRPLLAIAAFLLVKFFVQYFWVLETFVEHGRFGHIGALATFVIAIAILSLPLFFASFILLWILSKKRNRNLWFLCFFPLVVFFCSRLQEHFPFQGLPNGGLGARESVFFLFRKSFSVLGSQAVDALLFQASVGLAGILISSSRKFFLIVFIPPLVSLTGVCLVSLSPLDENNLLGAEVHRTSLNLLVVPGRTVPDSNGDEEVDRMIAETQSGLEGGNPDLIVWPESAVPGLAEQGRRLERLRNELLTRDRAILFGSDRKQFSRAGGFRYFNSAYLLRGESFSFDIYRKQKLVPFAEYVPRGFSRLGFIIPRKRPYEAGELNLLKFREIEIGVGICFEELFDSWYQSREDRGAGIYIFLNRETLFSESGREALYLIARAKSLQTLKPVIRVTRDGRSGWINRGVVSVDYLERGRRLKVTVSKEVSPFYRYGIWLAPLILLICGLPAFFALIGITSEGVIQTLRRIL